MIDDTTTLPFSDKYLRDILMNFLIAGRDTTAILLTWTFYLLAIHKDKEDKLIEEIERVLAGEEPSYDKVKEMPYLKAVLDETLRLYPPVPSNIKQAAQDDVLPNGWVVRKGLELQFNAYTVHRRPELWGPDADEFVPERWLEEGFDKKIHPYQYFPFHAGPRLCLGKNMAYLEAQLLICQILQNFRIRLAPGHIVKKSKSITLTVQNGLWVHVLPLPTPDH